MKMRPVASLTIEPGKPVTLAPGGYHIMLMSLKQALNQGDSFPVTLNFAKAGQVTATAMVEKAGATVPGMDHGNMSGRGTMQMPEQAALTAMQRSLVIDCPGLLAGRSAISA